MTVKHHTSKFQAGPINESDVHKEEWDFSWLDWEAGIGPDKQSTAYSSRQSIAGQILKSLCTPQSNSLHKYSSKCQQNEEKRKVLFKVAKYSSTQICLMLFKMMIHSNETPEEISTMW